MTPPPSSALRWALSSFDDLTPGALYELLALRQEVFVVEQGCHYLDADGVDLRALHLLGRDGAGRLCAYLRAFEGAEGAEGAAGAAGAEGAAWRVGRVLVRSERRGEGLGVALMREGLERLQALGARRVALHAQSHLRDFYVRLGFEVTGEELEEAGVLHLPMARALRRGPSLSLERVRHVLFDLDGTLVDSSYDYAVCFEQLALEWGHPPPSAERIRALMFAGLGPQLEEALGPLEGAARERAVARFREICLAHPLMHTQLYPGALALLEALRARGCGLSVCTNRPQDLCEQVLEELGLGGYFSLVVGGDRGLERKPSPAMVSYTLSALSLSPEEALMVGDSEVDVEAARAAGVACAAVAWGYTARGALAEAGPALILGRPGELEEVLDRCQPLIK